MKSHFPVWLRIIHLSTWRCIFFRYGTPKSLALCSLNPFGHFVFAVLVFIILCVGALYAPLTGLCLTLTRSAHGCVLLSALSATAAGSIIARNGPLLRSWPLTLPSSSEALSFIYPFGCEPADSGLAYFHYKQESLLVTVPKMAEGCSCATGFKLWAVCLCHFNRYSGVLS